MKVYNGHVLFETIDADAPAAIKDRNGDVVLDCCKVCGAGESELEAPCTYVKLTVRQTDMGPWKVGEIKLK